MFIKFFRSITMHGLIFCNRCNNLIWHLFGTIGQAFHDILLCFVLNVLSCKKSVFERKHWAVLSLYKLARLFNRVASSVQKKLSLFKKQNTTQGQKNLSLNVNLDVKKAASQHVGNKKWFKLIYRFRLSPVRNANKCIIRYFSTKWFNSLRWILLTNSSLSND